MGPDDEIKTDTMLSPASSKVVRTVVPEGAQPLPFEVVIEQMAFDPSKDVDDARPYRMLELSTEGRLYVIDTTFTCVEVIDRKTRRTDPTHAFVGARLIGGQRRDGNSMHQIKPFPIVGTSAVFDKAIAAGQPKVTQITSKVHRVVLYLRVANVASRGSDPSLDHSGAIKVPKL